MVFRANRMVLCCMCVLLVASAVYAANQPLMPDGFMLAGVDGELRPAGSGEYAFAFDKDMATEKGSVIAGQQIQMLPSTTLGYMLRDLGDGQSMSIRLWGTITAYHGRNYVFPSYYLQIASSGPSAPTEPAPSGEATAPSEPAATTEAPSINDANDEIRIPEELMAELKATRRVVDVEPSPPPAGKNGSFRPGEASFTTPSVPQETGDAVVVDRYGLMVRTGDDSAWMFRFDGLGRNVSLISFRVLPCRVLESVEGQRKPSWLEPPRYRIAGTGTRYKGEYYILPTRIIRAYDNGNFAQ